MNARTIEHVVWQHAEETALLWLRRENAVRAPHFLLSDLADHDEMLAAHIDGLRIAGAAGWQACLDELRWEEPGEVFAAAVMAFDESYSDRIRHVLKLALGSHHLSRAVAAALAWSSYADVGDRINDLAASMDCETARVGLAAAAAHRRIEEPTICNAMLQADRRLRSRGVRAVGEMGYRDLLSEVMDDLVADEDPCQMEAAWTCALRAREGKALDILKNFTAKDRQDADRAVRLLPHVLDAEDALDHLQYLANESNQYRRAIIGVGELGVPDLVDWLIELFDVPEMARLAGEAFTMITGLALDQRPYEGEWPAGFEAGPSEDPDDENVEMDPDENLPWPDRPSIADWWLKRRDDFTTGTRYLLGRPVDEAWCEEVLRVGFQRQRQAAATELAVRRPNEPLFEIRAPGRRQSRLLQADRR